MSVKIRAQGAANGARRRPVLFVAKGSHGIYLHGATHGNKSRESRYRQKSECRGRERGPVIHRDAEEHVRDQARSRECARQPKSQSRQRQGERLAEDHP